MRADDFFTDEIDPVFGAAKRVLDTGLIDRVRRGPVDERADAEVARGLARLVHDDLERFGTQGGEQLTEQQMREALLSLRAVAARAGVSSDVFDPPFRDYSTFRNHWTASGASGTGGYRARREMLNAVFDPLHERLLQLEANTLASTVAEAISPHQLTGWPRVDEEIAELRRHFHAARTAQDYRNVGNDAIAVLEALSAAAYDPAVHLRPGESEPAVASTKIRLERVVEIGLAGSDHEALRKLMRASIEFAQRAKHNPATDRREAGITADAVILLANMLRRLVEPAAASAP